MKSIIVLISLSILFLACNNYDTEPKVEGRLVSIHDTELFVKTMGSGDPILVIHGGPGLSHDYFLPHLESLAQDYQLIFYDQRASGKSSMDVDSSSITLDQFVEDINGIKEAYELDEVNLLAHSFGGLFAMKYAMKYPDHVDNLMLINSIGASDEINKQSNQILGGRFTEEDMTERMGLLQSEGFQDRDPATIEALMNIGFRRQLFDESLIDSLNLNINENYARSSELLRYLSTDLMSYDFHTDLEVITIPTLLVYGDYDPLSYLAGPALAESITTSKLVVLKGIGHFPFIEKPDDFKNTVFEFLEN